MSKKAKQAEKAFTKALETILCANNNEKLEALAASVIEKAIGGNTFAADIVINRFEGKVLERVSIEGGEDLVQLVATANELRSKIRGRKQEELARQEAMTAEEQNPTLN